MLKLLLNRKEMKNQTIIDIFSNESITIFESYNLRTPYLYTVSMILLLIFIFGVIFNIISIIHLLIKFKKLQPINILIINLAIADLFYIMGKLYIYLLLQIYFILLYNKGIPMFVS